LRTAFLAPLGAMGGVLVLVLIESIVMSPHSRKQQSAISY
jgi:hypothetical protein